MIANKCTGLSRISFWAAGLLLCGAASAAQISQDPAKNKSSSQHPAKAAAAATRLSEQLAALQAKVVKLEAALRQSPQGQAAAASGGRQASSMAMGSTGMSMGGKTSTQDAGGMGMKKGMGGMKSMKGMGMMKSMGGMMSMGGADKQSSSSMQGMGGMKSMGGMKGMGGGGSTDTSMSMSGSSDQAMNAGSMSMGSMGMGRMKRMKMMGSMSRGTERARPAVLSALPGWPGASHIYHIGAGNHFLEYADALEMTAQQRKQLSGVHEKSQLQQNDFARKSEQAEQELWVLTSAGDPDTKAVAAKVREISAIHADMRLQFIRSVGMAAKLLTSEQRSLLVGEYKTGTDIGTRK